MNQHDYLELARECGQNIGGDLAQLLTITFAMVIAIYYFLHQAGMRMKIFAFALYAMGMLIYLGMMLTESIVRGGAIVALRAIPQKEQSMPVQMYLAISQSWVSVLESVLLNVAYWVLWIGVAYLLFFWKRPDKAQA
ncbi:MAG TPA: hypothetical protein VH000_09375 [Rhizomicrobium sp.]|jgi:hypothetical protein|nr:hypothetical protein [Rhizomicrobium sp.]